jgi:hypothetical protein
MFPREILDSSDVEKDNLQGATAKTDHQGSEPLQLNRALWLST